MRCLNGAGRDSAGTVCVRPRSTAPGQAPAPTCKCLPLTYAELGRIKSGGTSGEVGQLGVKVYVTTGAVRFAFGEEFPATEQMTELRFGGPQGRPTPGTVSVVVDSDARTAEMVTHGGGSRRSLSPWGLGRSWSHEPGGILQIVGPVHSRSEDRSALLASCYRESLRTAADLGARTVAFPAISTGVHGRPIDDGARIAVAAVRAAVAAAPGTFDEIRCVVLDDRARRAYEAQLGETAEDPEGA